MSACARCGQEVDLGRGVFLVTEAWTCRCGEHTDGVRTRQTTFCGPTCLVGWGLGELEKVVEAAQEVVTLERMAASTPPCEEDPT